MDSIELLKKEMFRRRYSPKTIKTYLYCIRTFLRITKLESKEINKSDITNFLNNLAEKNYSGSTINLYLQSIKFMMEEILHKNKTFYHIKYSKIPRSLPEVLSKEETLNLFLKIENKKHNLMIRLMYSAGLRVSELVHLKIKDLEFNKNFGWVRHGKGNKDRLFIIANSIKDELIRYIKENNLNLDSWLFNGYKDHHLSQKSVYMIVKRAAKKANIKKKVHPHTLRHSFSTHLIENGYDITSLQSLLGHNSPETTMIYIHLASPKMISVKSPLDSLNYNYNGDTKNGL